MQALRDQQWEKAKVASSIKIRTSTIVSGCVEDDVRMRRARDGGFCAPPPPRQDEMMRAEARIGSYF
jgi:hypothetical protein